MDKTEKFLAQNRYFSRSHFALKIWRCEYFWRHKNFLVKNCDLNFCILCGSETVLETVIPLPSPSQFVTNTLLLFSVTPFKILRHFSTLNNFLYPIRPAPTKIFLGRGLQKLTNALFIPFCAFSSFYVTSFRWLIIIEI